MYSLEEEIVFEERNPAHAESDTALLEVLSRRRQTSRRGSLSCSAPELTKTKRSSANKSRGDSNNSNSARKRRSSGVQKGAHDGQQLSAKERVQQNTRRYTSTFLQPTLSSTTKSRDSMGSTQLSSCSTGSVHKATSSLTKPVSPKFRVDTRMRASAVGSRTVLTSEERELQRIAEEREAIKARMQKSNSKFAKRSKDRKSTTANSTITPAAAVNSPAHDGKRTTPTKTNSVGPSRQSAHGSKKKKKLTIPKTPVFRLNKRSEQRKKSLTSSEDTTKPTENKTTGIARVKEKKVLPTTTCHQLTVSRSPKLLTSQRASSAGRSRPLSHEETIQAEMEKIKPFKARQLDRRIFSSNGELGVPKGNSFDDTAIVNCHRAKQLCNYSTY